MPLDILINNAGFERGSIDFDKSDISNDLNMIDVNVKALHCIVPSDDAAFHRAGLWTYHQR